MNRYSELYFFFTVYRYTNAVFYLIITNPKIQRYAIIVEYFNRLVVFTETLAVFS